MQDCSTELHSPVTGAVLIWCFVPIVTYRSYAMRADVFVWVEGLSYRRRISIHVVAVQLQGRVGLEDVAVDAVCEALVMVTRWDVVKMSGQVWACGVVL